MHQPYPKLGIIIEWRNYVAETFKTNKTHRTTP